MLQVQPPNLYEEAYERIRQMLLYGEIKVGSRISSVALSKNLGISRTPIREAIRRLASEGLVKQVSGYGAFMQMPTHEELVELYDMRDVLESFAAAEAAVRITDAELVELDDCCAQWRDMVHQLRRLTGKGLIDRLYNRWITIDERFHEVLISASRNRLLRKAVSDMRLLSRTLDLRRLDNNSLSLITFNSAAWTYRHHASLVRALRRRDAELARVWMSRQISTGKREHLEHLSVVQQQEKPGAAMRRLPGENPVAEG
jgi:DNA-binding GntR family transcriptional regulator